MEKCIVCQRQVEDEEICDSCRTFFKWKYQKDYCKKLKRLKEALKKNPSLNSIKSNRRFKNG